MNILNFLLKIGEDILTKPNSTASQITQYALRNPQAVRDSVNLIGEAYKGLAKITVSYLSKSSLPFQITEHYLQWERSSSTNQKQIDKELFKQMGADINQKFRSGDFTTANIGLNNFAYRDSNQTFVGVMYDDEVKYVEEVTYDSIEPSFDRELNEKGFLLLN
ncbi:hypothetical protein CAPN010_19330 [Capnocytophaga cynodegmi]|uniref:hypothetical protein n=1 Tax=Capnocytophaga cynodegmi TaxID=28189 RepID=UPI001EE37396|nr:hypothetical protein [Capnocytophaga cynodegmi]GJQ07775.1 hypothetical protein CAPN010_19330 [Capnocytophaga cynodegmi]